MPTNPPDTEKILNILKSLKQDKLLNNLKELPAEGRQKLIKQLQELDWATVTQLLSNLTATTQEGSQPIEPAKPYSIDSHEEAIERGEEALKVGQAAAFTVAGGQGSRLGYEGPKGCFEVTPVRKASLFQVFAEKIRAAQSYYGITIPWVLMTSPQNNGPTKEFFEKNRFFGLDESQMFFFVQGVFPSVDAKTGALLLESPDTLTLSPNGTGGIYRGLYDSGALEWLGEKGVQILSYFQVDNPLVKIIDPLFVGTHLISGSEYSLKVLPKRDPLEKVGVMVRENGVLKLLEYSFLPEALARATDSKGDILYRWGSPAIHLLNIDFISRIASATDSTKTLPYWRALKKVPYWEGSIVNPAAPNAIKFEQFVFDALPLARNPIIVGIKQAEEFSPVKNATGSDSIETCTRDQLRLWASWLAEVGVKVPVGADGTPTIKFEITPLFADTLEALHEQAKAGKLPKVITEGMVL